jgi:hypothetical protein
MVEGQGKCTEQGKARPNLRNRLGRLRFLRKTTLRKSSLIIMKVVSVRETVVERIKSRQKD